MVTLTLMFLDSMMKMIAFVRGDKCESTKLAASIVALIVSAGLFLIAAANYGAINWPWLLAR